MGTRSNPAARTVHSCGLQPVLLELGGIRELEARPLLRLSSPLVLPPALCMADRWAGRQAGGQGRLQKLHVGKLGAKRHR